MMEFCDARIGCAQAPEADRTLCETVHACILRMGCAMSDPFVGCFCGTAEGTACLTMANGPCHDEIWAGTRSTNDSDAGMRFYSLEYPAGFATQEIQCRQQFCGATAQGPQHNACSLTTAP